MTASCEAFRIRLKRWFSSHMWFLTATLQGLMTVLKPSGLPLGSFPVGIFPTGN
jgi:hypothetical protein